MTAQPSQFWAQLAADHQRDLERFGPEHVKRLQAFRYFTFGWSWRWARKDPQVRFLLAHTSPLTWLACARERAEISDAAWAGSGLPWPRRDRWLYIFIVRLLHEYARNHDPLDALRFEEPLAGDPLPVRWRGRLISQDLCNSSLEAAAMARLLGGRAPSSILEIGAGYGRLGYLLLSLYPQASYTVVDIEPALTISRWYLSQLFAPERLQFLAPSQVGELEPGSVDLAVSISTLAEMTIAQVDGYLRLADRVVAADGGVYLKQLERWENPEDQITLVAFQDYPVPARWRPVFDEQAPVQTPFRQAGWRLPG
jgi:putative sugar O-methyltransferase